VEVRQLLKFLVTHPLKKIKYTLLIKKEHIRQEAIDLGIDSESAIRAGGTNIGKLELAVTRKKEQLRLVELNKTLGERLPWSASNKGYAKGQHVRFNGKNYIALVNVLPKQKFELVEWKLVE